ncbi:MAG: amidase [Leptolyngbyaceae cyanobacterium MAG.088]|nr:amidase [Leptolyngbyaceae cyanobacterium MAG.088]
MSQLYYLSALELRKLYLNRELSPVEVTKVLLNRIEQLNPRLNAYITVTQELALQQARSAEAAYLRGENIPLLAGIPTSLKDLTPTQGIPTTYGSLIHKNSPPPCFNATIVDRLYQAGIVLLGKTNTPEFGWKGDTSNLIVGPTHNPWKHGYTAGGSSGGAAAAMAAGLGALAQGSDGAGSIRIPSSFCGTYGFKPSWGLVPIYPASAVELMSHLGPITRTVRDAAFMLTVMAGADPRDPRSISTDIDYLSASEESIAGLRIAWSPDLGYASVTDEIRQITTKAAMKFEELGCHVEEVNPGIPDPWDEIVHIIWSSSYAAMYRQKTDNISELADPGLTAVINEGKRFSAIDVANANMERQRYYQSMHRFMQKYDLLLTPTLPISAFKAGENYPVQVDQGRTQYLNWTPFTYPFNITGQPAATVPCGFDHNGIPVGLQIIGNWRDDVTVFRASAAFEAVSPWEIEALP